MLLLVKVRTNFRPTHAMQKNRLLLWLAIAIVPLLLLQSCSSSKYPMESYVPPATADSIPNYSSLYYWAAHPYKKDLADSTPKPFAHEKTDTSVAVFFIHPTTYTDAAAVEGKPYSMQYWNASVNDAALNAKTDYSSMLNQASVFNRFDVYAPRYRQAHIRSFYLNDSTATSFFDTAYADIERAFMFFVQTIGNKPFIIASHSQGTLHAGRLLKAQVERKPIQKRLVAAYIIGLPVPEQYFSSLPACTTPNQTGCFVSWRTIKKGHVPEFVQREKFKAVVVNPLTWTMDTLPVPRSQSKGAVLYKFNHPKPRNVATQIQGNILWSSKPRFLGNWFFTTKNYHIGDINLFWKDIRDNAMDRVKAYQQQAH